MSGATIWHFEGVRKFLKCQAQPYHTLKGSGSLSLGLFWFSGMPGATLSHFEWVRVFFTRYFWGLWNARCKPITLWRGLGHFYLVFLRFVDCQVQPYHTLKVSRSRFLGSFKVRGFSGATLSHFEGVRINFTQFVWGLWDARRNTITLWMGRGRFYLVFSRFVECQVQPYHTLKGSGALLLSLFKVCGMPGAPLSHFEAVRGMPAGNLLHFEGFRSTFTRSFYVSCNARCNPITLWRGQGQFYLSSQVLWNAKCHNNILWRCQDHFYLVFLRFVEFLAQPSHTLRGLESFLLSLFELSGMPGAYLSLFEGVSGNPRKSQKEGFKAQGTLKELFVVSHLKCCASYLIILLLLSRFQFCI